MTIYIYIYNVHNIFLIKAQGLLRSLLFSGGRFCVSYRTHVFNDFSVVSKAVFYGLKPTSGNPGPDDYRIDKVLPVQINPDSLKHVCNSEINGYKKDASVIGCTAAKKSLHRLDSVNIGLIYDIYDEYNVRTCDGMTGAIDNSISLVNKDLTSLPTLQAYAKDPYIRVLFRWGDVTFFGAVESVDCTYKAFSRWGNPLKCDADVTIKLESLRNYDEISVNCFGKDVIARVTKHETKEKALLTGLMGAGMIIDEIPGLSSQALR